MSDNGYPMNWLAELQYSYLPDSIGGDFAWDIVDPGDGKSSSAISFEDASLTAADPRSMREHVGIVLHTSNFTWCDLIKAYQEITPPCPSTGHACVLPQTEAVYLRSYCSINLDLILNKSDHSHCGQNRVEGPWSVTGAVELQRARFRRAFEALQRPEYVEALLEWSRMPRKVRGQVGPCEFAGCKTIWKSLADYERHINSFHDPNAQRYPCYYCKSHRGEDAFKRMDHLTQHLRGYHMMELGGRAGRGRSCEYRDCQHYRDPDAQDHAFAKSADYVQHMRDDHNESPFPCEHPGCERVNGKGYFRKSDLEKHMQKKHGASAS